MTAALNLDATSLSPIALFLAADWVVKVVMLGLLVASVWTWTIIVTLSLRLRGLRRRSTRFEADFWAADDVDAFHKREADNPLPVARVLAAGVGEWRRSTAAGAIDKAGTRERLAGVMGSSVAGEVDRLADRLNVLATVGSVAPFVGLFGTVWGIMRSFSGIAQAQNTSLAVVAYNRLGHGVNRVEASLGRFADGFHAMLSRQLDQAR